MAFWWSSLATCWSGWARWAPVVYLLFSYTTVTLLSACMHRLHTVHYIIGWVYAICSFLTVRQVPPKCNPVADPDMRETINFRLMTLRTSYPSDQWPLWLVTSKCVSLVGIRHFSVISASINSFCHCFRSCRELQRRTLCSMVWCNCKISCRVISNLMLMYWRSSKVWFWVSLG